MSPTTNKLLFLMTRLIQLYLFYCFRMGYELESGLLLVVVVVLVSCSQIRRGIDGYDDSGGTPRTSLNDLLPLVVESYCCCCCCLGLDRKSVDGDMVFFTPFGCNGRLPIFHNASFWALQIKITIIRICYNKLITLLYYYQYDL